MRTLFAVLASLVMHLYFTRNRPTIIAAAKSREETSTSGKSSLCIVHVRNVPCNHINFMFKPLKGNGCTHCRV